MRAFAEFNDYEVVGEYEDAGKSGKSIEGRDEFNRMMEDIKTGKVTGDNIYKILIYFDKFYKLMNEEEQRKLMEILIEEIQIYEERQPSGQWLKSITFRLPIIDSDMSLPIENSLDSESHVETVVLMSRKDT